jgi:3-oxoadipate enol-lactonase
MTPVELHHRVDGPENAPVLVLGSSLGTTHAMWDDQLPAFAQRYRVLRYDTRGHGGSPAPDGPYTMEELGSDLLALLDRLELERVSFCGLSIGGMIGMWAASHAPARFHRLVLCCTVPDFPPRELWDERASTVRTRGMEPLVDAAIERWLPDAVRKSRPEAEQRLRAMLRSTHPEGYAGCCEAIRDMDLRDRLAAIEAPTLVIGGAEDPATPPERVRKIAEQVEGARYVELPEAAHLANIAQPDAFASAVLEHLTS